MYKTFSFFFVIDNDIPSILTVIVPWKGAGFETFGKGPFAASWDIAVPVDVAIVGCMPPKSSRRRSDLAFASKGSIPLLSSALTAFSSSFLITFSFLAIPNFCLVLGFIPQKDVIPALVIM